MLRVIRQNWALFVGMAMLMMANGLLVTLVSVRGAEIGFSPTAIGIMQAGYPLGALLGAVASPHLVVRVGHVRAFAALASASSVAAIVHLMTDDPWAWGAMRALAGVCFPGLYVITESWLNAKAENRSRALILSVYFVIQTAGASIGQLLAGIGDGDDSGLLFGIASILISLSLIPVLLSLNPAPPYAVPDRMPLIRLLRITPTGVTAAALNGAAQAMLYVGVPLYALARGLSAAEATLVLVTGTVAGAAAQFPAGWVSDRVDRRLVIGGLSLAGLAVALGLMSAPSGPALYVMIGALGACVVPIYALCVAHANDHIAPGQIVPASGALVLSLNIGILTGAFLGAGAIDVAGPSGLPAAYVLLCAATAAIAFSRRARSARPEDTGTALPISGIGVQTAGTIHPGAERRAPHGGDGQAPADGR